MKAVELSREVQRDIDRMQPEVIDLIRTLCAIPAPSHHEERRAAFIRDWFLQRGMNAEIDEAKNVLCPMGVGETGEIVVVMAHTDTVFPEWSRCPSARPTGRLYCPAWATIPPPRAMMHMARTCTSTVLRPSAAAVRRQLCERGWATQGLQGIRRHTAARQAFLPGRRHGARLRPRGSAPRATASPQRLRRTRFASSQPHASLCSRS